ncbi:sensor histidine kinase NtrY-like [Candidatus Sneabacter namystus]|uniref:Putative sensor histidine kinase NtrY-like n=1 Tax=Candidatus Sneabacter namystus TaxID=2601646 RepID=A0A5C0UHB8_9RICK|nr:ATP-binding protein [Candidatus Sneabacter namystus]QEK39535.1 HAMP domain-containing protein [Candidatus Sneabacter namystus]
MRLLRFSSVEWLRRYGASVLVLLDFVALACVAYVGGRFVLKPDVKLLIFDNLGAGALSLSSMQNLLLVAISSSFLLHRLLNAFIKYYYYSDKFTLSLRKKITIFLNSVAIIPAITTSVFAIFFLNSSLRAWFDEKITCTIDNAVDISKTYVIEHKTGLFNTARQLAWEIESQYKNVMDNREALCELLNSKVDMGVCSEVVVFRVKPTNILARSTLSFFSPKEIPFGVLANVKRGEAIEMLYDSDRIHVLASLPSYEDIYIVVSRVLDQRIVDYLDYTHGALESYKALQENLRSLQIRFAIIFVLIVLIFLFSAIYTVSVFAVRIVLPIRTLASAISKVQQGDLSVGVPVLTSRDEIASLGRAFNDMVVQLKRQRRELIVAQKSLAWSDVARRVAHEINNPLTPIKLSAELLQSKFSKDVEDKANFEKYTNNISKYVDEIKSIVLAFSQFVKLPQPELSVCDLKERLSQVVHTRISTESLIKYSLTVSNDDFSKILCDGGKISQVVNNLITNSEEAIKMDSNSGNIAVDMRIDGDYVSISVQDDGSGFEEEVLSRAVEPYFSTKSRSTGLGLAIVSKIIEEHSGILKISNLSPKGAVVTFKIPLKQGSMPLSSD